ncbi:MAG: hypothetical protein Ct9H300mP9_3410 [Candidatus Neomarinimicrobiota bacterium]|nr:MAG: hypothetical protein Ct9H300mP9_3410 [Candidatus Neomarinimicrobiota bacterium]
MQWVDVVETLNDTARVYANSLLTTNDITMRLNWTFSPDLSLQCFVQPFYANMRYKNYYRLKAPETMELDAYDYLGILKNLISDYRIPLVLLYSVGNTVQGVPSSLYITLMIVSIILPQTTPGYLKRQMRFISS